MLKRDIIVIGTSAGGVEALSQLVACLPAGLPAALFVVMHFPPEGRSWLPQLLSRAGPLPAKHPANGEMIHPGRIYVAPPDHHLLLEKDRALLMRGPKENNVRPAIDPLFRSAAHVYRSRVIGVILTGMLDDGTAGLLAVKMRGGLALVQDPAEAAFPEMPKNAKRYVQVDHTLPLSKLGPMLVKLCQKSVPRREETVMSYPSDYESELVRQDIAELEAGQKSNQPTFMVCPECGGSLWELGEGAFKKFQCRVGHRYSMQAALAEHRQQVERVLWIAVRTLDEQASLSREFANLSRQNGEGDGAEVLEREARDIQSKADQIKEMISGAEPQARQPSGSHGSSSSLSGDLG